MGEMVEESERKEIENQGLRVKSSSEKKNLGSNWVFMRAGKLAGKLQRLTGKAAKGVARQLAEIEIKSGYLAKTLAGTDVLYYKKVVEMNPDEAECHYKLGMALLKRSRRNEAAFYFKKAVFLDFHHIRAYIGLAGIYRDLVEGEKAREMLEKALKFNPDSKEIKEALAAVQYSRGIAPVSSTEDVPEKQVAPKDVSVEKDISDEQNAATGG